jgi:hypothetical protein
VSYYHIMKSQVSKRDGNKYIVEKIPRKPAMEPLRKWIAAHPTGLFSLQEMRAAIPGARADSAVALLLRHKEIASLSAGMYKRLACKP